MIFTAFHSDTGINAFACSVAGGLWLLASFVICRTCQRSEGVCWRRTDVSIPMSTIPTDRVWNKESLGSSTNHDLRWDVTGLDKWMPVECPPRVERQTFSCFRTSDRSNAKQSKKPNISRDPSTWSAKPNKGSQTAVTVPESSWRLPWSCFNNNASSCAGK